MIYWFINGRINLPWLNHFSSGRGAWQNWSYDMEINSIDGQVETKKDIHQNENIVLDLQPNTTYSISVTSGPLLNASFTGKTLANSRTFRGIFWATNDAIQETTPLGRDVRTLANIRLFQVQLNLIKINITFFSFSKWMSNHSARLEKTQLITERFIISSI